MKLYMVESKKDNYVEPVIHSGIGGGPLVEYRDMIYVCARNRVRAKALALRAWRHEAKGLCRRGNRLDWLSWGDNPFDGMRVTRLDNVPHGRLCDCDLETDYGDPDPECPRCEGNGWYPTDDGGPQHAGPRLVGKDAGVPYIWDEDEEYT